MFTPAIYANVGNIKDFIVSQEKLDALLKPMIKKALRLEPQLDDAAKQASEKSKYGGLPYAEIGDEWPICPTCKKPLIFVSQIRNQSENELVEFFYCFDCFPWGMDDEEKGQWNARVYTKPSMEKYYKITPKEESEFYLIPCLLNEEEVTVLPDWDGLESVSKEAETLCSKINDDSPWEAYDAAVERSGCLNDYVTLLGGYPRYVQSETGGSCRICNKDMEFFAQLDSEEDAGVMWGDVGLIYLYRCPDHKDEFHMELQCH
jgi:uncharacterized protein YwqG